MRTSPHTMTEALHLLMAGTLCREPGFLLPFLS